MESESGKGSGFNRTAFTTPKIAVFAPIPRVSTASAERVKPGFLRRTRIACVTEARRSRMPGEMHVPLQPEAYITQELIFVPKPVGVRVWHAPVRSGNKFDP